MKILVADPISKTGVQFLADQEDFEVVEAYGSTPEQVLEIVKDVEAIIVRSETTVSADVIAAAPKLKAVGRAGVGVDNIDIDAATEHGVVVMNTPGGNTIATAELTFSHILCGTRPIVQAGSSMQAGKWDRKIFKGSELRGKTLGVLGLGRIGAEVSKRAQAFDMKVLAYDPYLTEERAMSLGVEMADLNGVFKNSDYITVHMPLTDSTRNMICTESIAKMKDGVRIFNCARGGIINEADIVEALNSGKVAAAGLDVFESEPLAEDSPLRNTPNLVLTPHLGASTKEAQESVGIEIAECIAKVLRGEVVQNALNMPSVDARTLEILKPYFDLGEKLGTIIQQICPNQINKLKITYWGKIVDYDAMPLTRAIQKGYLREISGGDVNDINAPMLLKRLGVEVEVVKSNTDSDFTELIRIEATDAEGATYSISGTLLGKMQSPRVVEINGHSLEVEAKGTLMALTNKDVPGIVGMIGTKLGKDEVNIAKLSLSRDVDKDTALAVYELDTVPSDSALKDIESDSNIKEVRILKL